LSMELLMNLRTIARHGFGAALSIAALGLGAGSAHAAITVSMPTPVTPLSDCSHGTFSQPLLAFKDNNFYTLAPGGNFEGPTSWELSRGASVQADGSRGGVLDLPSGAQATSPPLCITSDYPRSRLFVRNVAGAEGVSFNVSYLRNGVWTAPQSTGQAKGDKSAWTLSNGMNIKPSNAPGWQQARFTLVAGGTKSRFQVDDFWVDPKMRG
jgi:hypothetical protein